MEVAKKNITHFYIYTKHIFVIKIILNITYLENEINLEIAIIITESIRLLSIWKKKYYLSF